MCVFLILATALANPGHSAAQEPDAELISHKTTIVLKKGRLHKTYEYAVRINNRDGEKYSTVSIPYSNLTRLSRIRAHVMDDRGNVVRQLKNNEIRTRSLISGFSFYEDHFVREFTLRHNSFPYIIHYSYEMRQDQFLSVEHWTPVLHNRIPTLNATLIVELPVNFRIFFRERYTDPPVVSRSDQVNRYTWTTSYSDLIEPELFSPPPWDFLPGVVIMPEVFNYELMGSAADWLAYGDWQYGLLEGLLDLPGKEKLQVRLLLEGIDDEHEKIRILYNYLQDRTRYINVSIGTGGLKPYPASYVAANKYGDCKALTNYFRALLDVAGICSNYATIHAGNPAREIDRSFPSQQFNHAILCIPLANDTIWLDCTSKEAFGYTGTFIQNRDVLVIDKGRSHFARTPSLSPEEVLNERRVRLTCGPRAETVVADFKKTYRGQHYESLFYISRNISQSRSDQIIRTNHIESGFDVMDYFIGPPGDSAVIELTYSGISRQLIRRYNDELFLGLISFSLPRPELPGRRKMPVQIDYPLFLVDTLEYLIPEGYTLANNPGSLSLKNQYGEYHFRIIPGDNTIMVTKSFLLNPGYYSLDEYEGFYEFLNTVRNTENSIQLRITRRGLLTSY
jgi:hypothetical protein